MRTYKVELTITEDSDEFWEQTNRLPLPERCWEVKELVDMIMAHFGFNNCDVKVKTDVEQPQRDVSVVDRLKHLFQKDRR